MEGGATVYVSFVYRDEGGQEWGYAEQYSANQSGWARMSDLTLVYDSKEFMKDHQAELNENASETLEAGDTFYIWTYPESGKRDDSLYTLTSELTFDTAYTDVYKRQPECHNVSPQGTPQYRSRQGHELRDTLEYTYTGTEISHLSYHKSCEISLNLS